MEGFLFAGVRLEGSAARASCPSSHRRDGGATGLVGRIPSRSIAVVTKGLMKPSERSETRTGSRSRRFWAVALIAALAGGCIERTVTIKTEPEGATVILNDQEVGKSPVRVPFTWYGDYDIILRKRGYQTVRTHQRLRTPWYEYPIIDIFSETLMPFTIHDDRELGPFVLEPFTPPSREGLLERAAEMRGRADAADAG